MHKIIQICGIPRLLIPIFLECHCELGLYWSHNPLNSSRNPTKIVQGRFLENIHIHGNNTTPHNRIMLCKYEMKCFVWESHWFFLFILHVYEFI